MRKLMIALIIAVIWLAVLNLTVRTGPEPDEEYPMTNRSIEWRYAGK